MLNAINPEKQKERESQENEPGAALNQDLEVEETKTEPKESDLRIEKAQSQPVQAKIPSIFKADEPNPFGKKVKVEAAEPATQSIKPPLPVKSEKKEISL